MNVRDEVLAAEKRIRKHIRTTPLEYSGYLSSFCKANVHLKLENYQLTGSFKIRGALNKVLSLTKKQREAGVVAASTGNHALGVAHALEITGGKCTIYVPTNTSRSKLRALQYYPIKVRFFGKECEETEVHARKIAKKNKQVYISPYNDLKVIGGHGTIGIELKNQLKKIDYVFASIGGGGFISGIAGYLKSTSKKPQIVGCLPKNSPVMYESIKAGRIVDIPIKQTLSDGTAGGIEQDSITFDLCRKLVDDYILVTENEIKKAIKVILENHHMVIEGAAAVTVASFIKRKQEFKNKNVVLVICGRNISSGTLKSILNE
jgi:threonine dehydratase